MGNAQLPLTIFVTPCCALVMLRSAGGFDNLALVSFGAVALVAAISDPSVAIDSVQRCNYSTNISYMMINKYMLSTS